jgi:hypothetical protein
LKGIPNSEDQKSLKSIDENHMEETTNEIQKINTNKDYWD